MPAVESKMQSPKTSSELSNGIVIKCNESFQGDNWKNNQGKPTTCTRRCLPCSTQGFELSGDESIAIVLNGNINTDLNNATHSEFKTNQNTVTAKFCINGTESDLEDSNLMSEPGVNKERETELETIGNINFNVKSTQDESLMSPPACKGGKRAPLLKELEISPSRSSLELEEELIADIMQSLTVNVAFSPKLSAGFFNVSILKLSNNFFL